MNKQDFCMECVNKKECRGCNYIPIPTNFKAKECCNCVYFDDEPSDWEQRIVCKCSLGKKLEPCEKFTLMRK